VFIELVTGSTSRLLDMVQRYEVDAALISEPFTAPELATQKAFDEELVLIAARSATGVLDPEQLSRCTVIAFPAGCSYRRILEEWFASTGCSSPHSGDGVLPRHRGLHCSRYGIGIMPRSILKAVHAEPQLQVLSLPRRYAEVTTHLVWLPRQESASTEALRQMLAADLPPVKW
jgi:DNA-binding transcriptional LysR family regulator